VLWTAVPEAAADVNDDPTSRKHDVLASPRAAQNWQVDSIAQTSPMQFAAKQ
jgi:hypothetical protein